MVIIEGIKLYNIEETAELLGITSRTLQRWTAEGENDRPKHISTLRPVSAPNGKKLFKEEDILNVVSHCLEINVSAKSLADIQKLAHA
ncbi:MAG: MerR family transcriptional regulator [Acidobacteriaceae bacterium]